MSFRVQGAKYIGDMPAYSIDQALQKGQVDEALMLFKRGASIDPELALKLDIYNFLRKCIPSVDVKKHGMSQLSFVVSFQLYEDFNEIVQISSDKERDEALLLAVQKQIPYMVFLLLMSGASLDLNEYGSGVDSISYNLILTSKKFGDIALNMKRYFIRALKMEHSEREKECLQSMLDSLYSMHVAKRGGHSPIWDAINRVNSIEIVIALREAKDLNVTNDAGELPLNELLKRKIIPTKEIVLEALNNFANPLMRDENGMNAFHCTNDPVIWNILSARTGVSYDEIALEVKGSGSSDEENQPVFSRKRATPFKYVEKRV